MIDRGGGENALRERMIEHIEALQAEVAALRLRVVALEGAEPAPKPKGRTVKGG